MKANLKLLVLLSFLFSTLVFAVESGVIKGKIKDDDNYSLAGANVYIKSLGVGTSSNQNGEYTLVEIPEGKYEITISYLGYKKEVVDVTVQNGKTTLSNVTLKPATIEGKEIVVMGDRLKGQAKALSQQRSNENISNIISSEQMGRFPDANIGDALKRVPAINVYYDQGEARYANIRGTEPKLNSVMINGERMPSAEGDTRAIQLDLVSSDMVQTIEVNKAVMPEMDADAIGGSINLITRFAPNGLRLSGTLGSGYNLVAEKPQYIGSFILGQRFADNKLGVILSGSYFDNNFGSNNVEGDWAINGAMGNIYPNKWEIREYRLRRLRENISAAVDYEVSPTSTLNFNAIYTHRNDWENRYGTAFKLGVPDANGLTTADITKKVKAGSSTSDGARLEEQNVYNFSLSGKHLIADVLSMDWAATYSKASEEKNPERYISFKAKKVSVSVDYSDLEKPYVNPVDLASIDNSKFKLDALTDAHKYTDEKNTSLRLNFNLPLIASGDNKSILKFGGKYKAKDKERKNNFFSYTPLNGNLATMDLTNWSDFTNSDFLAGNYKVGNFPTANYIGNIDVNNSSLFKKTDEPSEYAPDNYTATEKVTAGYAQLEQNLGSKLLMIAGVRIENTSVNYTGNKFNDQTESVSSVSGSDSYTDFLPGIHFKYNFDENTILRLAWTNTLSRPNYYDLVPYFSIAAEDLLISMGNPSLKPTRSTNLDLMGEKYFETVGLVSAGVFYKNIKDFTYAAIDNNYSYNGETYTLAQPRNGGTATLYGFEFAFQRQLDFLPGFMKNLGIYFNYTYNHSETDNPAYEGQKIELPGTAPSTLNAALTYQDADLNLGLSFNYAGAYLDPEETILTPGLQRYYDEVTYLDFSASYQFMKGFRLFFEANNLLNQPLRFYAGESQRTYQAEYYNMRFSGGAKFDL